MKLYAKTVPRGLGSDALHDAAYALLLEALQADWGIPGAQVEKTPRGKPYLAGENMPFISLSHTDGFVCCAVSDVPVGVDCEHPRRVSAGVMRRVCTEAELADIHVAPDPAERFLQYWTLKESISKKRGVGLAESFRAYSITFVDGKPLCAGHRLHLEMRDGYYLAAAE